MRFSSHAMKEEREKPTAAVIFYAPILTHSLLPTWVVVRIPIRVGTLPAQIGVIGDDEGMENEKLFPRFEVGEGNCIRGCELPSWGVGRRVDRKGVG